MRIFLAFALVVLGCTPEPSTLSRDLAGSGVVDAGGPDAVAPGDAATDATADASVDAPPVFDASVPDAGCVRAPEPECPTSLDGYLPMDPDIASGAQCRGACGPDCPATCEQTSTSTCIEWQDECGWHAKVCTYDVRVCGSHQGCRDHDSCYDRCATAVWPAGCRRQCDLTCINTYDLQTCDSWRTGGGPFDSQLSYLGAATSYTYDSTCY